MREIVHLAPEDARLQPWKNGRGVTKELAVWPVGASFGTGVFDWRISTAGVDEPGPFSTFPGTDRVLVVTHGAELMLDHGDSGPPACVRRLQPYRFSGDWPTTAELPSGPISDFNVLFRRGRAEVTVEAISVGAPRELRTHAHAHTFLHCVTGPLDVRFEQPAPPCLLRGGASVWVRGAREAERMVLTSTHERGSAVLHVVITTTAGA